MHCQWSVSETDERPAAINTRCYVLTCREADKDMVIKGYRVPKGVTLMLSPHPMHVSSLNYLHPDKFWPERWVSDTVTEWDYKHSGQLMSVL